MKRIWILVSACALIFGCAALAQQQASTAEQPPEITQFQKIEDQWSEGMMKRDQYALENVMSATYVDISSVGEVTTRNQQVALLYEAAGVQPVSMEQRVINVRTIEDVAVVDGTYIRKWKANGGVHEERGIFTHVFQHARGSWVCVHSQRTAVVEKAEVKAGKAQTKKSSASEPFHIPLLYKGKDSAQPAPAPGSSPAPQQ